MAKKQEHDVLICCWSVSSNGRHSLVSGGFMMQSGRVHSSPQKLLHCI